MDKLLYDIKEAADALACDDDTLSTDYRRKLLDDYHKLAIQMGVEPFNYFMHVTGKNLFEIEASIMAVSLAIKKSDP